MMSLDDQRKLVRLAGTVSSPYELTHYNVEAHRMEVWVFPEPSPSMALVNVNLELLARGNPWAQFVCSVVATGLN